jgi:hypothetical protein
MKTNIQESRTKKTVFRGLFSPVKILATVLVMTLACLSVGCDNEEEVEEVYKLNTIDSIKVISGDMRAHVTFWVSEAKTKNVIFYLFPNKGDTLKFNISEVNLGKPINFTLGEADSVKLTEGKYNLKAISFDASGNRSAIFWVEMHIYGNQYKAALMNRKAKAVDYQDNSVTIAYDDPVTEDEIGIVVNFTDMNGGSQHNFYSNEELASPLIISDIDLTKEASYQSLYVPGKLSLDTLQANPVYIAGNINVALGKTATASDYFYKFEAQFAVDGIKFVDDSRWVPNNSAGEHWLQIDLGEEYEISAYQVFIGAGGALVPTPTPPYKFQAYVNGAWVTLDDVPGPTNAAHQCIFANPVKTQKVRIYIPEGNYPDRFRLFEIEVLAFQRLVIE